MITKLAQFTDVRIALVVGGLSLSVQAATLRTSPEILVATPVRDLRLYKARAVCIVSQSAWRIVGRNLENFDASCTIRTQASADCVPASHLLGVSPSNRESIPGAQTALARTI